MEFLQSQEGDPFTRAVAQYIRQHEKALANSLQLTVLRRKPQIGSQTHAATNPGTATQSSTSTIAAALSLAGLNFRSSNAKSAQLTLTPHHLFYLLSRAEGLDIDVGPMNVRMESLHSDTSPANYISFLQAHDTRKSRGDTDSIHSVSSVRSVMSGMSQLWSSMGLTNSNKTEKARLALLSDIKYIYAAFTKLPALRLTPDRHAPLIKGYEQFPFDTAVPLFAFKNVQQLEIVDLDFRSFHGWDRLAEQLCFLTVKRGSIDDPIDLLENIVLDDSEKRPRRSNRSQATPSTPSWSVPSTPQADYARSHSDTGSPQHVSPGTSPRIRARGEYLSTETTPVRLKTRSHTFVEGSSPKRPTPMRPASAYRHSRSYSSRVNRSGSGSSQSSEALATPPRTDGHANTWSSALPASKWQRLVYLSLADNGLTALSARSIQSVAPSLRSFNLSSNLFTEIPESLANLSRLVSLDLSNCMIESLQTITTSPLPAITTLKLKSNRLQSLSGIERLPALENLNIQDNKISDPDEAARLSHSPNLKRLWVRNNPLTKKYSDYRVRLLNHFRRTPGRLEDIILDDQPATYSERKLLIDRAVEHEPPSTISLEVPTSAKLVSFQHGQNSASVLEASHRLSSITMQRQLSATSNSRKRSTRRRIVDLSDNDVTPTKDLRLRADQTIETMTPVKAISSEKNIRDQAPDLTIPPPHPGLPVSTSDVRSISSAPNATTGDDYKRDVEELRLKLGHSWLSALGEQHGQWQSDDSLPTINSSHIPPPLHHYHSSPPAIGVCGSIS